MAEHVTVVARVRAKRGMEQKAQAALMTLIEPTRREKGCLNYDLHVSVDDPAQFIFYENWTSKSALDDHLLSNHIAAVRAQAETLFDGPIEITLARMVTKPAS